MDRERLTELLQDPSQVADRDLTALRTMAERFPWFSGAHLLLAVGEHETGDVLANDPHSTPAAFLPSRAVLFDLVRKEEQMRATPLRVVKDEAPLPTAAVPTVPAPVMEPQPTPPEVPGADIVEEGIDVAIPDTPMAALPKDAPTAITPDLINPATPPATPSTAVKVPEAPDPAAATLDLQIQQAILATGYALGRYEAPPAAAPARGSFPPAGAPSPAPPVNEEMALAPPPSPTQDAPAPAQSPIHPGTRLRFMDWLDRAEEEASDNATPVLAPSRAVDPAPPMAPPPPPIEDTTRPDPSPQEIMEQFIQRSSPPATAAKAEFFNPQQAAKRSLQDDGLVSETLARIHEKQGNFAKAREVYDRLAVKHPEKSVYFAALSKALEGRMHK